LPPQVRPNPRHFDPKRSESSRHFDRSAANLLGISTEAQRNLLGISTEAQRIFSAFRPKRSESSRVISTEAQRIFSCHFDRSAQRGVEKPADWTHTAAFRCVALLGRGFSPAIPATKIMRL
jgi:hypothetical protein